MSDKLSAVRKDYVRSELNETTAGTEPNALFKLWLSEAEQANPDHFNAMTLATMGNDGYPHARIVLLRSFDSGTLSFFTNYESAKGRDLDTAGKACINFFWDQLERQVRIYGAVSRLSAAESDAYFQSRPRESQIGAWASAQSRVLDTREELEQRVADITAQYAGSQVPRPDFWGGYALVPHHFEFWQGRSNRLHDRIRFIKNANGAWIRDRLSP